MPIVGLDEGKWEPNTVSENNPVDQAVTLNANTEFLVVAFHLFVGSHALEELQVWLGEPGDETAQPLTRQIEAFDAGQYVGIFTLNNPDMAKATNIRTQNVAVTAPYCQAAYRTYDADGAGIQVVDRQAIAHDTAVSVDLTFSGQNGDVIYDSIQAFNTAWTIDLTELGTFQDLLGYRHRTGEEAWDTAGAGPHGMSSTVAFAAHGGLVLRPALAGEGNFSIEVNSLTAADRVEVRIGTTPGGNDVADFGPYTTTGFKAETFTPTASTLYIDIRGYDNNTDAHTILIDNVSIDDGGERIINGGFTTDLTGWTSIIATNAVSSSQLQQTGFGGPASPTTLRQSFATSFSEEVTTGGHFVRKKNLSKPILPPKGKDFKNFTLSEIQEDGQPTIDRWVEAQVAAMRAANPMEEPPGPPPKTRRLVKFRNL